MECNNDGKWSQTLLISNEDHNVPPSSLAFVRENYWVVVVPVVVLCIVASLCVSYQEKYIFFKNSSGNLIFLILFITGFDLGRKRNLGIAAIPALRPLSTMVI